MKIQIIVGSVRENRVAIHVAEWMQNALQNIDAEVEVVDLKTWDLPMFSGASPMSLKGNYSDPLQKNGLKKSLKAMPISSFPLNTTMATHLR